MATEDLKQIFYNPMDVGLKRKKKGAKEQTCVGYVDVAIVWRELPGQRSTVARFFLPPQPTPF